jgi:UDP-N-acetylmuramate dehydrogenase
MPVREDDLKFIKGTVKFEEPMSGHTTFKIGGPAEIFIYPSDEEDLLGVLEYAYGHKMGVFVIGGGSKLLVGDKGIRGFVISLNAPSFKKLDIEGDTVIAGCGLKISELLKKCSAEGLGGLEFLSGIPGTLGGALVMNAGWPARAIGDYVEEVALIRGLEKIVLGRNGLTFSYRSSNLEGNVLLSAKLKLEKKPVDRIEAEIKSNLEKKRKTQDLGHPSVGSLFLNPSGKVPAWRVVESCGFRGKAVGGAAVSEKHANFVVNKGGATAADVRALIDEIQKKVFKEHQIVLKLEAKLTGDF